MCPALVLWSLRILPLGRLPLHRDDRFSRSIQELDPTSRRLNAGCRAGSFQDCSRAPPGRFLARVLLPGLPNLSPQRKKEKTLEALIHQLEEKTLEALIHQLEGLNNV